MYLYLKALHIIFVVTWFAGLFYIPRLFIYNTEANEKPTIIKDVLQAQFKIMMKRLWYAITLPSAIITLFLGIAVLYTSGFYKIIFNTEGKWLMLKLIFVLLLYLYHFSLQKILNDQLKGVFKYTSQQLRIWNEVATILLFAIIFLVSVKQSMSLIWGLIGLLLFIAILISAIKIYKEIKNK